MILIVLVLRTMEAFKVFDIIWIMTGGGPANATQTIAIYAYQTAYQGYDFGRGAALGYLIALVIMVLAAVYLRLLGRRGGRDDRRDRTSRLAAAVRTRRATRTGLLYARDGRGHRRHAGAVCVAADLERLGACRPARAAPPLDPGSRDARNASST